MVDAPPFLSMLNAAAMSALIGGLAGGLTLDIRFALQSSHAFDDIPQLLLFGGAFAMTGAVVGMVIGLVPTVLVGAALAWVECRRALPLPLWGAIGTLVGAAVAVAVPLENTGSLSADWLWLWAVAGGTAMLVFGRAVKRHRREAGQRA